MRGRKIESRQGIEFTAEIATCSEWFDLRLAIVRAIRESPLVATGLQPHCEFPRQDCVDLLPSIKLYSTGNTTKEQVRELLERSVPEVLGIRDLQVRKVVWSEKYDPEYEIDFPDLRGPSIPFDVEFASDHNTLCGTNEPYYRLDGSYDEDSSFVASGWPDAEDIDVMPVPNEQILRHKKALEKEHHARQEWVSYHSEGRSRFRKPIDPKTLK